MLSFVIYLRLFATITYKKCEINGSAIDFDEIFVSKNKWPLVVRISRLFCVFLMLRPKKVQFF